MKKLYQLLFWLFLYLLVSCSKSDDLSNIDYQDSENPINSEIKEKFIDNLNNLVQNNKIIIGHQSTNVSGIGWRYHDFPNGNKSDFKDVSGKMPAMMGWEFAPVGTSFTTTNEGIPFAKIIELANQNTANNGINTFSLHPTRFDNNNGAWDSSPGSVQAILPNGNKHQVYKQYLDDMAAQFAQLKLSNGKPAPFIFRPYHEMDGAWFWWGISSCSDQEYIQLFRFTIDYLRSKKLSNMVVCYAPGYSTTAAGYLKRYPGDEYVDILGIDAYHISTAQYSGNGANWEYNKTKLLMLQQVGLQKNKPIAWTETGQQNITSSNYFSELKQFIETNQLKLSHIMFWFNARTEIDTDGGWGYYIPFNSLNNTVLKNDFINFCNQPQYIFQNSNENIYN